MAFSQNFNRNQNVAGTPWRGYQQQGPGVPTGNMMREIPPRVSSVPAQTAINMIPQKPPGLEALLPLTQLLMQKDVEGCTYKNAFHIKSGLSDSEIIYSVMDQSDCSTRCCWGPWRSFEMKILDNFGNETIHLHRSSRSDGCCSFPEIEVFSPPDTLVATIQKEFSCTNPIYTVKDANRETVLTIEGPFCCSIPCFSDVHYEILSPNSRLSIGRITKEWVGICDTLSDFHQYSINFPGDLDVRMKAGMIGACVLIVSMVK